MTFQPWRDKYIRVEEEQQDIDDTNCRIKLIQIVCVRLVLLSHLQLKHYHHVLSYFKRHLTKNVSVHYKSTDLQI